MRGKSSTTQCAAAIRECCGWTREPQKNLGNVPGRSPGTEHVSPTEMPMKRQTGELQGALYSLGAWLRAAEDLADRLLGECRGLSEHLRSVTGLAQHLDCESPDLAQHLQAECMALSQRLQVDSASLTERLGSVTAAFRKAASPRRVAEDNGDKSEVERITMHRREVEALHDGLQQRLSFLEGQIPERHRALEDLHHALHSRLEHLEQVDGPVAHDSATEVNGTAPEMQDVTCQATPLRQGVKAERQDSLGRWAPVQALSPKARGKKSSGDMPKRIISATAGILHELDKLEIFSDSSGSPRKPSRSRTAPAFGRESPRAIPKAVSMRDSGMPVSSETAEARELPRRIQNDSAKPAELDTKAVNQYETSPGTEEEINPPETHSDMQWSSPPQSSQVSPVDESNMLQPETLQSRWDKTQAVRAEVCTSDPRLEIPSVRMPKLDVGALCAAELMNRETPRAQERIEVELHRPESNAGRTVPFFREDLQRELGKSRVTQRIFCGSTATRSGTAQVHEEVNVREAASGVVTEEVIVTEEEAVTKTSSDACGAADAANGEQEDKPRADSQLTPEPSGGPTWMVEVLEARAKLISPPLQELREKLTSRSSSRARSSSREPAAATSTSPTPSNPGSARLSAKSSDPKSPAVDLKSSATSNSGSKEHYLESPAASSTSPATSAPRSTRASALRSRIQGFLDHQLPTEKKA